MDRIAELEIKILDGTNTEAELAEYSQLKEAQTRDPAYRQEFEKALADLQAEGFCKGMTVDSIIF